MELFHAYKVEILNKEFRIGKELRSKKIAQVVMFDYHGNKMDTRDYGLIQKEEVYQAISEGKAVDLNNCYVKDFSLSEYRKLNNLNENDVVEISSITAMNAFFDADHKIDFSYALLKSDSEDFVNTIFSCNELSFVQTRIEAVNLDFTNARFHCKNVNFQYATFHVVELNFKDVKFQSDSISFINCNFSDGKENFSGTDFGNANVAFQFARFGEGDISFEKTRFFGNKIDFSKVEFGKGRVDFRLSTFCDGTISFDECELEDGKFRFRRSEFGKGRISFEMAQLKGVEVNFERCEFGNGELSFLKAEIGTINLNSAQLNNHVDLRVSHCEYIDLMSTIVRDIVDLSNEKDSVRIEQINFSNMRNLGRLFLDYYDNDVKRLIYSQKFTSVKMKAEQFRLLKEEFRALGQYNDEDKAYLEFKRLELEDRRIRTLRENKLNAIWFYPVYYGEKLIFDQIGHYATNPMRVLISMIIAFMSLTFCHLILMLTTNSDIVSSVDHPEEVSLFTKSIYHSTITFLTIGYGDYFPSGAIRWLSGIEGFIGLFLMSYFTVAFVRKVLR